MRKLGSSSLLVLGLGILLVAGCSTESMGPIAEDQGSGTTLGRPDEAGQRGFVVVADRGSGTISVIDAKHDQVIGTHMLPAEPGEPTPEPMYVVYVKQMRRVFVGDRANDRVAVFNARDFSVVGTVPAGAGVFHMWADPQGQQMWVNNDIDKTTTVFNPKTLEVIATVPTPADLVDMGGKPHDVILGPQGDYAYVTVLGFSGPSDYVVQFSTDSFMEVARAAVGKDPHLSVAQNLPWLFVPCQNTDEVYVLELMGLGQQTVIAVPGAHGAGMSPNGRFFYTTNLPGGGAHALYTISTKSLSVEGMPVDTPYMVPHNIAIAPNGKKLFVTHSGGMADKVTIYETHGYSPIPVYAGEVTVGFNPFGLTYVP